MGSITKKTLALISCSLLASISSILFSGCGSEGNGNETPVSYDDVNITQQQAIKLTTPLDTPVRIVKTQQELDALYSEIRSDSEADFETLDVNFSDSVVVYMQQLMKEAPWSISLHAEKNGVRLTTLVQLDAQYRYKPPVKGLIAVVGNGNDVPLFFTKSVYLYQYNRGDTYSYSMQELNRNFEADLIADALPKTQNDFPSQLFYFTNRAEYNDFVSENLDIGTVPSIDWQYTYVISSGVLQSNASVSFSTPLLQLWREKSHDPNFVPDNGESFMPIWNFIVNGYRSECAEFSTEASRILLYSIPAQRFDYWYPSYQTISAKSCTGYTQTPQNGVMDWFDDEIIPLKQL